MLNTNNTTTKEYNELLNHDKFTDEMVLDALVTVDKKILALFYKQKCYEYSDDVKYSCLCFELDSLKNLRTRLRKLLFPKYKTKDLIKLTKDSIKSHKTGCSWSVVSKLDELISVSM